MFFRDIVGQEEIIKRFILEVSEGRVPHARLLCGPEGTGKLPLAIAYARYLCCSNRTAEDACGTCPSCMQFNKLAHPDLHFVFPVIKKGKEAPVSDDYISEWRNLVTKSPYFNLNHWLKEMGAENQQAMIYEKESGEILRKLSLKSFEGGYKVMIVWLPEKMNESCSNKLLKILEEPPTQTVIILVSENPDLLLATIRSRTQCINFPRIDEREIETTLERKYGLGQDDARFIAHASGGDFIKALEAFHLNDENKAFFDWFVSLMRLAYQRKVKEMKAWSEQLAGIGRERQKNFLSYCQRMIRENFIYNFHQEALSYMNREEKEFAQRFSPFVNERNAIGIMDELNEAQRHIEHNVNAKMVFFDFSLKMIVLIKQ